MIDERKLKEEFAASKDLQAEFGNVESFVALRRHENEVAGKAARRDWRRASRPQDVKIDEAKLQTEFAASKKLQDEFSGVDAFLAFKRAEASGRIQTYPVLSTAPKAEAARLAAAEKARQEDEARQYAAAAACDSNGVLLEV